ncbi:MAG: hypothetical protein ABI775_04430 [Pseudonocardiales bacterium]|nr:hypothetical protein [Actinomycetota bacterium]
MAAVDGSAARCHRVLCPFLDEDHRTAVKPKRTLLDQRTAVSRVAVEHVERTTDKDALTSAEPRRANPGRNEPG